MRPGFGQFNTPTPEFLRFAAQYGVKDVLLAQPQIPDAGGKWAVCDLVKMRIQVENEGLRLMAIENVPLTFYQEIIVGGPNRERQIENMVETIRNIGAAGIPIFGYHWIAFTRVEIAARNNPRRRIGHGLRQRRSAEDAEYARSGTHRGRDVGTVGGVDPDHYTGCRRSRCPLRHTSLRSAGREAGRHTDAVPVFRCVQAIDRDRRPPRATGSSFARGHSRRWRMQRMAGFMT